jgi:hypothetical protein
MNMSTLSGGQFNLDNPLVRLSKDLKAAAMLLSDEEARYLVDAYYQVQKIRVAQGNQVGSMERATLKDAVPPEEAELAHEETILEEQDKKAKKEPHSVLDWFVLNAQNLEGQMKRALDSYSDSRVEGRWAKTMVGIGPVIAAGLMAHIDMNPWTCALRNVPVIGEVPEELPGRETGNVSHVAKVKLVEMETPCTEKEPHPNGLCARKPLLYAGQIWNFAGIGDPLRTWEKGQRRPWNAKLKTLTWKIGQSFLKQSTRPNCYYGHLLRQRWEILKTQNERRDFAVAAAAKLEKFKIGKSTDAYKAYIQGFLPPAHVLQRACRYATKIFLSHYHCVAYKATFGKDAALPYAIAVLGHKDYLPIPNPPAE